MARTIKGLQRGIARMQRHLEREPRRSMERGATTLVADMRANVGHHDAIASTELLNGIQMTVRRGQTTDRVQITSLAGHSGFVEFGTGPKHIPNPYTRRYSKPTFSGGLISAIIKWVNVKPTIQAENPGALGWAIARVISGEAEDSVGGTKPQPFFFNAWEQKKPRIVAFVKQSARESTRKV